MTHATRPKRQRRLGRAMAIAAATSLVVGGGLLASGFVWLQTASDQLARETSRMEAAQDEARAATVALGESNQRLRVEEDRLKQARKEALRSLDAAGEMADAARSAIGAHRELATLELKSDRAFLSGDIDESNSYIAPFNVLVDLANTAIDEMWDQSAKVLPVTGREQVDA